MLEIRFELVPCLVLGYIIGKFNKDKSNLLSSVVNTLIKFGIPISLMFWWATKIGYQGFGTLWPVRFMGFATSMMTFPIMTWLYLGEVITLKTGITILLAAIIMLLQLL